MDVRYCPKCAAELVWRFSGDRERPTCPVCGFVFYFNPVVGAGVLVETDGRVVLVRRGVDPKAGYWSLPSGYVEADELTDEAAVREAQEETGLEVEVDDMVGVYSFSGHEPPTGVLILYAAHVTGGVLRAGADAQEVRAFAPDELPADEEIAFRTHLQALHDWRRARAIVYRRATTGDRQVVAELSERYQLGDECLNCLAAKDREGLLAWDRGQLAGLACVSYRPWSRSANIEQVFVSPGYRRWGIATQLVNRAIAYAHEQRARTLLAVAPVTNPLLFVYLKAGFRVSGFIDSYCPPGSQELVTALFLAYGLG